MVKGLRAVGRRKRRPGSVACDCKMPICTWQFLQIAVRSIVSLGGRGSAEPKYLPDDRLEKEV
jgi:hypothetical protein